MYVFIEVEYLRAKCKKNKRFSATIINLICNFSKLEQDNIRYRSTATLRRPQIKQHTASNERGGGDIKPIGTSPVMTLGV